MKTTIEPGIKPNEPRAEDVERQFIYVSIFTDDDGYITSWKLADEDSGVKISPDEFARFSDCSGTLYKVEDGEIVYDETLEIRVYNDKLDAAKKAKVEEMSMACENTITNGFKSAITGEMISYGYNLIDQQNWDSLYEAVKLALSGHPMVLAQLEGLGYPKGHVCIKGTGRVPWKPVSFEAYIAFWLEGKQWVAYNRQMKYYPMRDIIDDATSFEEIEAIVWKEE